MAAGYSASLQTASTATSGGNFAPGAVTFGAPGQPSALGEIAKQVLIAVLAAVAGYYALKAIKGR